MKISKLFHWLYGLVMLLPIFAIGVTCGYAMFNKNAKDSYYGENINERKLVQVSNFDDIELDNSYQFNNPSLLSFQQTGTLTFNVENVVNNYDNTDLSLCNQIKFYSNIYNNNYYMLIVFYNGSTMLKNTDMVFTRVNVEFDLINYNYTNENTSLFLDYLFRVDFEKESFVSEVFYYSVDRVTQSNLFSWSYNSFLVTPFAYIVSLFSMPINSPVVMLLSYWLSISIIWLVFDLVMYVPLLVHRWLDKGAIE